MKRLLLVAVLFTLGGCAFMSDEDKDFYGRGWIKPTELDNPSNLHTPKSTGTPAPPTQGPDPAWDVPANDAPPARPY